MLQLSNTSSPDNQHCASCAFRSHIPAAIGPSIDTLPHRNGSGRQLALPSDLATRAPSAVTKLCPTWLRDASPISKAAYRRRLAVVRAAAEPQPAATSRRDALRQAVGVAAVALLSRAAPAAAIDDEEQAALCDASCASDLAGKERVTTASGLQYIDLVEGKGLSPPKGYQVTVDYVAMTPEGRIFDSSLAKGYPYQIRVGAGQVVPGLDEGLLTMATGGVRRLYIPGDLAFPKGLPAAAGRPRVAPASPVVFDVKLLRIPGVTDDDEDEA
ncbi:Peptidyl-prolyl cis-trans isomerase FKBP16-3 [Chlorella vulgaris]